MKENKETDFRINVTRVSNVFFLNCSVSIPDSEILNAFVDSSQQKRNNSHVCSYIFLQKNVLFLHIMFIFTSE